MRKDSQPKKIYGLPTFEGFISFNGSDIRVQASSDYLVLEVDPRASTTTGLFFPLQCLASFGSAKPCSCLGNWQHMDGHTASVTTAGLTSDWQASSTAFFRHLAFALLFLQRFFASIQMPLISSLSTSFFCLFLAILLASNTHKNERRLGVTSAATGKFQNETKQNEL